MESPSPALTIGIRLCRILDAENVISRLEIILTAAVSLHLIMHHATKTCVEVVV
jgi:hypothetical protein